MEFDNFIGIENQSNRKVLKRKSVRVVAKHDDKYLMISTIRGDLIFPGGAREDEENYEDAAKRELIEETGYKACHDIKYIGRVVTRKIDQYDNTALFETDMLFYQCTVEDTQGTQKLSLRESELEIKPLWLTKQEIIERNRKYNEYLEIQDVWVKMVEYVLDHVE